MSPTARARSADSPSTAADLASLHGATVLRRESSARAVQKISALGEMTGGIAHDFRNVLAVVSSGLRIAEQNVGDPAKLTAALAAAQEGVERGRQVGGYVTVDSKVGRGTSFDLLFPVHEGRPAVPVESWPRVDRGADEGGAIISARSPPAS